MLAWVSPVGNALPGLINSIFNDWNFEIRAGISQTIKAHNTGLTMSKSNWFCVMAHDGIQVQVVFKLFVFQIQVQHIFSKTETWKEPKTATVIWSKFWTHPWPKQSEIQKHSRLMSI